MNKYKQAYNVIDTVLHLMCGEEREDGYEPTQEEMAEAMDTFKELVEKSDNTENMDNLRKIKEITYSSEYVANLERQLELAREKNAELKKERWLIDCCSAYYLEAYKQALKQAVGDAMSFVSNWSQMIAEGHEEEQELLFDCMDNNKSSVEGIAEFYFRLVCKSKDKEEWSKRK
nr:MAG TPA: hypothetical protein [Caudoviricetes sp.]